MKSRKKATTQTSYTADNHRIRPLQTNDLRYRRLSGRHQIAYDGRHLIDGVPFGRAFLRHIDRPKVRIPPRKRPRLIEGEDNWNSLSTQGIDPGRIILRDIARAVSEDGVEDDAQDEDDHEFLPEENTEENESNEEDDELASEVRDLEQDGGSPFISAARSSDAYQNSRSRRFLSRKRPVEDKIGTGLGVHLRDSSSSLDRLNLGGQDMWIGPYENPLLDEHYNEDVNQSSTKRVKRSHPQHVTGSVPALKDGSSFRHKKRGSISSQSRNVRFEVEGLETPATVIAEQDTSDLDYDDLEAPSGSNSGSSESDKENVRPGDEALKPSFAGNLSASNAEQHSMILKPVTDRSLPLNEYSPSQSSSSGSSSDSVWKSSYSSEDSHSSSTSETTSDLDSDSDSSSDSGSDSECRSAASEANCPPTYADKDLSASTNAAKTKGEPEKAETQSAACNVASQQAPPGQGSGRTQKRNRRRRISSRYKNLHVRGIIPSTLTRAEFKKWEEENRTSVEEEGRPSLARLVQESKISSADPETSTQDDLAATLQAKKTELLQSLGGAVDGQVASNETLQTMVDDRSHVTSNETLQAMVDETSNSVPIATVVTTQDGMVLDEIEDSSHNSFHTPNQTHVSTSARALTSKDATVTPQSHAHDETPNKRRARLDIASSRRMLFGSLGVRAPKTQEDVEAIRQKLSANTRIAPQPKPDASLKPESTKPEDVGADDSWKAKITLKAVECCHDGIELSTPPFPFVQRWDPQQKGEYNSRKLSKKQKRRASQYYGNSGVEELREKLFLDEHDPAFEARAEDAPNNDQTALYPTLSEEYQSAANEQLLRDSGVLPTTRDTEAIVDDAPQIPTNIETFAALGFDDVVQGATIAFKQLEVSARTCWQPQVSEYRIGSVENVFRENEPWTLCLRLVNNEHSDKASKYDPDTGERIYGKFEMPVATEEEDENYLEINFDDMIEPKLIRPSLTVADRTVEQEGVPVQSESMVQVKDTPQEDSLVGPKIIPVEQHFHSTPVVEDSISQERQHRSLNSERQLSSDGPDLASRKEVSLLIKDAGFRTSLDPEAARKLENLCERREERHENPGEGDAYEYESGGSPSFNGFGSSPPRMNDDDDDHGSGEEEIDVDMDEDEIGEGGHTEQGSGDEIDEDDTSKSNFEITATEANQRHTPDANIPQIGEERLQQSSHSTGWYAPNLRGTHDDSAQNYESSHDEGFDATDTGNFEGISSGKAADNTDLSNLDGTTEITNFDGASYDMIGTQAAPKLGTSSPNPLPSPIAMPTETENLPSAQSSDQLPETIPPTSTSISNGDLSPRPFRTFSKSPNRNNMEPVDQASSFIHQSKAQKTLVMRGEQDLRRDASFDSLYKGESDKPSASQRTSDSENDLPSFEAMFHSQRSSTRSPIQLSSDPPRPTSSSPPRRPYKNGRISLNVTKESKSPDDVKRSASLTASQRKIKRESLSQSQTRIKEEQLSQQIKLLSEDGLNDYRNSDYESPDGDFGTQIPKLALEKNKAKTTKKSTRPKEAVIVDLTQDSDLQSPGGSDYGSSKNVRGARSKKNGGRSTQSLGGETFGSDIVRAARKRVVERTRSRV